MEQNTLGEELEVPEVEGQIDLKISKLENEKKQMHDEFNAQRAKMKELFLQKESECKRLLDENKKLNLEIDEIKSQLLIAELRNENVLQEKNRLAEQEIATLQHLARESIKEASEDKINCEKYYLDNERLRQENRELRELINHQETVLSQMKKTLVRKLGADSSSSHENLEESMRKAQEDAEVLRSLVVPLEEEIKALKEKLRTTDEELQLYRNSKNTIISNGLETSTKEFNENLSSSEEISQNTVNNCKATSTEVSDCENCINYKTKLIDTENFFKNNKDKLEQLQNQLLNSKSELLKEASLRKTLEEEWQEKREKHKEEVQYLNEQLKKNEKEINNLHQKFLETKQELKSEMLLLIEDRENINKHLETLQNDNDYLSGKYLSTSEELQNQKIDLPNDVEELQLLLLKQHDENIQARVAYEFEKRKCVSYIDEIQLLRDQLNLIERENSAIKEKYQVQTKSLEKRLTDILMKEQNAIHMTEEFRKQEENLKKQFSELNVQCKKLREANEEYEKENSDLKYRIKMQQSEIATGEQVQKDFVKLSQNLQISLETFRQADTQVRWQDDDDIENCSGCNILFTVLVRKQHCRHCGAIYCEKCLTKSVPTGPRKKPARVCDMCHTLLIPDTAPYFSTALPQSSPT